MHLLQVHLLFLLMLRIKKAVLVISLFMRMLMFVIAKVAIVVIQKLLLLKLESVVQIMILLA
jgi:hypothetical protein